MNKDIRLLSGEYVDVQAILPEMLDDDFYYNYLGKEALSSSAIKSLLDGSYFEPDHELPAKTKEAFKVGRLIHLAALEPHRLSDGSITVAECKTRASRIYKDLVEQVGAPDHVYTRNMVNKAESLSKKIRTKNKDIFEHPNVKFEDPAIGEVLGMPFRGKADIIIYDYDGLGTNAIIDLKTTSNLQGWKSSAYAFSYDIQLYIYCHLFNVAADDFYWLAAEKSTGDSKLFCGSEALYNSGKKKVEKAIKIYINETEKREG